MEICIFFQFYWDIVDIYSTKFKVYSIKFNVYSPLIWLKHMYVVKWL